MYLQAMITTLFTHFKDNPILAYLTTGAAGGILGGLLLLGIQTTLKQGVAYQYKKKLKGLSHQYDEKIKSLDYHYNTKLAYFNAEIAVQADNRKEEIDKKFHEFTLYSTKRHEIYPELFSQIYKINAEFASIRHLLILAVNSAGRSGNVRSMFEELDSSYSVGKEALDKLDYLYNNRGGNLNNYVREVRYKAEEILYTHLSRKLKSTGDFFMGNLLYYSEDVLKLSEKLLGNLGELLDSKVDFAMKVYRKFPTVEEEDKEVMKQYIAREAIEKMLIELRHMLQEELSIKDISTQNNNS